MKRTQRLQLPQPWIVGESPSRSGDRYWQWPLSGAPAKVLCQCAGFEADGDPREIASWTWALYERFATINLFQRHADAVPWSAPKARDRAEEILDSMAAANARRCVLLGRRVGSAFGVVSDYFEWTELRDGAAGVVVPHPSGRNLMLNETPVRMAIGVALREATSGDTPM